MAALAIGSLTVADFGQSWDEASMYGYANYALQDYRFLRNPVELAEYRPENLIRSSYYIAGGVTARFLTRISPSWTSTNAWHFVYFVTFLCGAAALYSLAGRWMSTASALAVVLLYMSQPVFWGHAFINPKDIPLMAVFVASIWSGFRMTDGLRGAARIDGRVVPAAILVGVACSLRVAGPLAGLIVLVYTVYRLRRKALPLAGAYILIGAVTTYLSWPFLWNAPINRYWSTVGAMADFGWNQRVLFAGRIYEASQLPASYLPTFLAIQLTEPALLLCLGGIAFAVADLLRRRVQAPILLFLAWSVGPAMLILALHSTLYDNGRQTYFLLPPLFIVAGLAFERLFMLVKSPSIKALIILLAVLPGIVADVRLHPYEYVYYNALVGGTGGAYRRYEMDYWATSMKETTEYLNSIAAAPINVRVYGPPAEIMTPYARRGVNIYGPPGGAVRYDYLVMLIRAARGDDYCQTAPIAYKVEREGAVFSIVRRSPDGAPCH